MEKSRVTQVNVPYPDAEVLKLRISIGACRLSIAPDAGDHFIHGTYDSPAGSEGPRLMREGGDVRLSAGQTAGEIVGLVSGFPVFDVKLGNAKPFGLAIDSGASDNVFDFGGLPLERLELRQGAGKTRVDFSSPNPGNMERMRISVGACALSMTNLANANFTELTLDGGAASYICDFGGALRKESFAKISTGMSSVEIRVPESTAAKISTTATLGNLDVGDGFTKKEGAFWTPAAMSEATPVLTIRSSIALGLLKLRIT
ncbi:MAG: hypothetical protein ACYC1U_04125 [Candidatus Aquicultorales bacterium]